MRRPGGSPGEGHLEAGGETVHGSNNGSVTVVGDRGGLARRAPVKRSGGDADRPPKCSSKNAMTKLPVI